MAVNKDFVVKNGLEVNRVLIRTNTTNNRVGINTDIINATLDVNGSIVAKGLSVPSGVTTFSNINLTDNFLVDGFSGSTGQYLRSTGTGVTWANFPSTRTSSTFTAITGQTLFPFSYTIGLLDVFVNGTKLAPSDFNASDGLSVTLVHPCIGGENVELIGYSASTIGITTTIGIGGITLYEEGSLVGLENKVTSINFVGAAVTAVGSGVGVTVYITDSTSTSFWESNSAGISTLSSVGIGTTNPTVKLEVEGDVLINGIVTASNFSGTTFNGQEFNISGIVTATSFSGSGSDLTGIVTSITAGSGISIDQSTGNVTITATGGGGGGESFWVKDVTGIHTSSNVGIATTEAQYYLQIDRYAINTGFGTFVASPGVTEYIDSIQNAQSVEYTLFIQNGNNIQSQKVMLMNSQGTTYSQEYAIMFNPNQIVSVGSTSISNFMILSVTPESGISGLTTYRLVKNILI